jgi:SAM-dependent methyltransferase
MAEPIQQLTEAHYDRYHFIEGGATRVKWWREYLRDFLPDDLIRGRLVVDVGSSVGEISRGLLDRGARVVCLDVSFESLRRCRINNARAEIFHGSALDLPFADNTFDHAVSIGVLHHTPSCREGFREVARVTAPGGTIVIFLYNYWNIYNPIYHAFIPVRKMIPLDRVPRWVLKTLQPFARKHLGQSLDEVELRNLLGDLLWTPRATFHSVSEVRRWGVEEGLTFVASKKFFMGYANVMQFRKSGSSASNRRRLLQVRCVKCGAPAMALRDDAYTCDRCAHVYQDKSGIFETLAG